MTTRTMTIATLSVLSLLATGAQDAHAGFGAGLSISSTEAVTGEYAIKGRRSGRGLGQAIEATVGRDTYVHMTWKFYIKNLVSTSSFTVPLYTGFGPFAVVGSLNNGARAEKVGDTGASDGGGKKGGGKKGKKLFFDSTGAQRTYGARVPVGVAMEFRKYPAHVFLELSAQAEAENIKAVETTTALGFRYFF